MLLHDAVERLHSCFRVAFSSLFCIMKTILFALFLTYFTGSSHVQGFEFNKEFLIKKTGVIGDELTRTDPLVRKKGKAVSIWGEFLEKERT